MSGLRLWAIFFTASAMNSAAWAATLGSDLFETGTTLTWEGATTGAVPDGGPDGATDHYLEADTVTTGRPHLAIKNGDTRWTGDFVAANITRIMVDVKVLDGDPLDLRVVVMGGSSGFDRATSTVSVSVPSDGQWHHLVLPISPSNLTVVLGSGTPEDILQHVSTFMLRNQSGPPSSGGTFSATHVGFDNITAAPPPIPGDVDNDADVDAADLAALSSCRSGSGVPHPISAVCTSLDFDTDGDVDQNDFGVFQRCYTGAHRVGSPNCAH